MSAERPTPPAAAAAPHTDQVLNLVNELEDKLEALKQWQRQSDDHAESLRQQAIEIDRREAELQSLGSELSQRKEQVDQAWQAVNEQKELLTQRQQDLDGDRAELDEQREQIAAQQQQLEAQSEALLRQRSELEQESQRLEGLREELEGQRRGLAESRAAFEQAQAQFEAARAEVEAAREQNDEARATLLLEKQRLETDRVDVRLREQAIQAQQEQLDKLRRRLAEETAQAGGMADEARQNQDAWAEVEARRRELNERERQLESVRAELEERRAEVQRQQEHLAQRTEEVERRAYELEQRAGQAESADAAVGEVDPQREAQLRQWAEQLKQKAVELDARSQELDRRVHSIDEQWNELDEMQRELDRQRAELESRGGVASPSEDGAAASGSAGPVDEQLRLKEQALDKRAADLQAEKDRFTERSRRLKHVQQILANRRHKLRRYLHLLRDYRKQLEQKRQELVAQSSGTGNLNKERQMLAEVRQFLEASEAEMVERWATRKALSVVTGAVFTMVLLAAVCWFAGQQIVKPVWAASMAFETPKPAGESGVSAAQWLREQVDAAVSEPVAREAMNQLEQQRLRLYPNLTAFRQDLRQNLEVQGQPGRLEMRYRSTDREHVTTVLEAVGKAYHGYRLSIERTADAEADAAKTAIQKPAARIERPIEDHRLIVSGIAFGGTCVLALIVAVIMRAWLRRVQRVIDADSNPQLAALDNPTM